MVVRRDTVDKTHGSSSLLAPGRRYATFREDSETRSRQRPCPLGTETWWEDERLHPAKTLHEDVFMFAGATRHHTQQTLAVVVCPTASHYLVVLEESELPTVQCLHIWLLFQCACYNCAIKKYNTLKIWPPAIMEQNATVHMQKKKMNVQNAFSLFSLDTAFKWSCLGRINFTADSSTPVLALS